MPICTNGDTTMRRVTFNQLTRHPKWDDREYARLSGSGLSNQAIFDRWNQERLSERPIYGLRYA